MPTGECHRLHQQVQALENQNPDENIGGIFSTLSTGNKVVIP